VRQVVNKYCKRDLKCVRTEARKLEGEWQLGRYKPRRVERRRGLDLSVIAQGQVTGCCCEQRNELLGFRKWRENS
jgi:hypothetical protein